MPRIASLIRFWVLVWLLISQVVAVVVPVTKPHITQQLQQMQLFCTSIGMQIRMVQFDDGTIEKIGTVGTDCPLCTPVGAPPALPYPFRPLPPHPLVYALQTAVAAHIAIITAAPLPARGPPVLF